MLELVLAYKKYHQDDTEVCYFDTPHPMAGTLGIIQEMGITHYQKTVYEEDRKHGISVKVVDIPRVSIDADGNPLQENGEFVIEMVRRRIDPFEQEWATWQSKGVMHQFKPYYIQEYKNGKHVDTDIIRDYSFSRRIEKHLWCVRIDIEDLDQILRKFAGVEIDYDSLWIVDTDGSMIPIARMII
jgi:hypothetical protein